MLDHPSSPSPQSNEARAPKPDWAMTRAEKRRQLLKAAGLEYRVRWWPILICIAAIIAAVVIVPQLMTGPTTGAGEDTAEQAAPEAMLVHPLDVLNVTPQTLQDTLRVAGPLAPRRQVQLSAGTAGTVTAVNVRLGDRVTAGDILVEIDAEAMRSQLAQQKAALAANKAQLALAESQVERSERLAERGIATEATLETDRRNLEVQRANLRAQEATVEVAEIALRNAILTAPFDGIVASRDVEPGQTVANGANLVQIVDLSTMLMSAVVPVSHSVAVRPGLTVSFAIEGLDGREFSGRVVGVSPTTVPGTRTTPVSILIENTDHSLRGGMFATGLIVLNEAQGAIGIPPEAVLEDDAGHFVLKIVDGRVERQPVVLGRTWTATGQLQIQEGLTAGDTIISRPLRNLAPGMTVRIAEA